MLIALSDYRKLKTCFNMTKTRLLVDNGPIGGFLCADFFGKGKSKRS